MTLPRAPRFIQRSIADTAADRAQARAALLQPRASAAPKYFYDRLGSQLFEAITELPEYYPTRTEAAIFATHGAAMARHVGAHGTLIDLGAGNCAKAARLLPLFDPRRYLAIDISVDFLRDALRHVQREHPQLDVVGLGLDFSAALDIPDDLIDGPPTFFYPGSSIGNFTPDDALAFLTRVRERCAGGTLLIGVDLVKPAAPLEAAYADALGVTGAFNLNLLRHLNRLIGSDFRPEAWRHVARYDTERARVEMHLEARTAQTVQWPGAQRHFEAGERIHTESSYKYTLAGFAELLRAAGFHGIEHWSDPQQWFAVYRAAG
jgi:dimethylhistidine N-methyltransferase